MKLISFEAKFYNGEMAQPHQAIVELNRTNLLITTQKQSLKIDWPYKEIKLLEHPVSPQPARLTSSKMPNARLVIETENWHRLKGILPQSAFPGISLSTNWKSLIGFAGLSVTFILGFMLYGPKLFEYASHMIPQSTEEQIGQLTIESLVKDPVCVAPQGKASLEKMVKKIQQGMKRNIAFNVRVISDDEILNAFAAPGGHLVIYSGILKKAHSVNEMAGVLAHEMAHIEMNHPMKSLMRDLGASMTLHMMFGSTGAISNTAKLAGVFNQLHYSRQDELEADIVGQDLLKKANIDPSGLEVFFERGKEEAEIEKSKENSIPEFLKYLSTHPHTQERINNLKTHKTNITNYRQTLNEVEWQALKNICTKTIHISQN